MNLFKKHSRVLKAAEDYYVNNIPTGLSDEEYSYLEKLALDDGINPRNEAFKLLRGSWVDNADYITDVPKTQIEGSMYDAIKKFSSNYISDQKHEMVWYDGDICDIRWIPKYDGSSVICYYENGIPYKVVTAGGMNKNGQGVDQTWKLLKYFPEIDTRIKSLHCELLVSLEHGFGEKSRQKANGLVNSTKDEMLQDVEDYINIRAFRYFTDYDGLDYIETIRSLPEVRNQNGDIKFAPGCCMTFNEIFGLASPYSLSPKELDSDVLETSTGTFLIDGWVAYTKSGEVIKALKYKDAGKSEFTKVIGFKWNDKSLVGKDSWSCNAIIEPTIVRGVEVTKPTCPINKIYKDGMGVGSLVTLILANSTIPSIDKIHTKSDIIDLPVCKCGTVIDINKDNIYGNNLKCPNKNCSYRYENMTSYLNSVNNYYNIDFNKLLIIDRFDFNKKVQNITEFYELIRGSVINDDFNRFNEIIRSVLSSNLQKRNLELVVIPAFNSLSNYIKYEECQKDKKSL